MRQRGAIVDRRSVGWLVVLVSVCGSATATAQPDFDARVERAAACYARFDYDCVLELLGEISIDELAGSYSRSQIELAVRLAAVTYIVRNVPDRARQLFYDLLTIWPDYRLEGADLSPRFFAVFNEARAMWLASEPARAVAASARRVGGRRQAGAAGLRRAQQVSLWARDLAAARPVADDPRGPADLRIDFGLALQRLFGNDADVFDSSVGLAARIATRRFLGLVVGLGVDWLRHDVTLEDLVEEVPGRLKMLTLSLSVQYPIDLGRFELALGGAVGYSTFGLQRLPDRGGPAFDLVVQARARLIAGLALALEVRPRLVVAEGLDGLDVSTPLLIGVLLGWDFELD